MKVAILTQPLLINYGGLLQNYALQQVLIKLGHTPITLDHLRKSPSKIRFIASFFKNLLFRIIKFGNYKRLEYRPTYEEDKIIRKEIIRFKKEYLSLTELLHNSKDFIEKDKECGFEAYVVGSDQCWRPRYNYTFLKDMFLEFLGERNDVVRIAYGVSFGTDNWEMNDETTSYCARFAQKFKRVTVRESSGIDLCKKYLNTDATLVFDPTLLLSAKDYFINLKLEEEKHSSGDLFYYILDPSEEKRNFINLVSSLLSMKPFTALPTHQAERRLRSHVKNHIEDCVYPSVECWLKSFVDAKMTIVDSYHGMVFSIIFNKPFWVICNHDRGMARFKSLLNMLGIEERMIEIKDIDKVNISSPIDWLEVNRKVKQMADFSINLLKTELTWTHPI